MLKRFMTPSRWAHGILLVVCYVPLLATRRGQVVADTKQYLFLDPVEMMRASTSLWDPDWAMGTVTHQSIGYLWPMAPFYATGTVLGVPVWVMQRLWLGSIVFFAASGVLYLGRRFGFSVLGSITGALLYGLAPYALAYATRMSALIMPWAALPWLIGLAISAVDDAATVERVPSIPATRTRLCTRGRWRDVVQRWRAPVLLGAVATTVGAINASSLIYVGLAVIAWFPYAVWDRQIRLGPAVAVMIRIGVSLVSLSAWWAVALVVQAGWGPDVLRFSETLEVVASGSPASEAWRGLGYWVFYGRDRTGPWVSAALDYTQSPVVMAATFVLSLIGAAALFVVQWRHRVYALGLAIAGLLLTVGLHRYDRPSILGELIITYGADSSLALALRSSPRAMPLFLLAVACTVAAGIDAIGRGALGWVRLATFPRRAPLVAGLIIVVIAVAIWPLWRGRYVGGELARDEALPQYWHEAADYLNSGDPNARVLILPGADFSAHRWGNTIDHILPGLIERPVAVRELIPYGSSPSADLLIALDRRAQERLLEPEHVVPILRLMGVGHLVVQNDLETERYRTPRPDDLWAVLGDDAHGWADIESLGPPVAIAPNDAFPMIDELRLWLGGTDPQPASLIVLGVPEPMGVLRLRPAAAPLIVAGDGEGLVELAATGRLDDGAIVLYEASLTDTELAAAFDLGGELVITDTNRSQARRWKTVRDTRGMTESREGDGLRSDPSDARLDPLIGTNGTALPPEAYSWTHFVGLHPRASSYGNAISFHPEDRAVHAVDDDPDTAWRVAAFGDPRGEWIEITWDAPQNVDGIWVLQPQTLERNRRITAVDLSVDDGPAHMVTLDESSWDAPGQFIALDGAAPFRQIRATITDTTAGIRPGYGGLSAVGFAEIQPGSADTHPVYSGASREFVLTPSSAALRVGESHDTEPVPYSVLLSRDRVDPTSPVRDDPETAIRRIVTVPHDAVVQLDGTLRLAARGADDDAIDAAVAWLGDHPAIDTPPTSSARLPGPVAGAARAVTDGDPATLWRPPLGEQIGQWIELDVPSGQGEVDTLTLSLAVDDWHSWPSAIDIASVGGADDPTGSTLGPAVRVSLPDRPAGARGDIADIEVQLDDALTANRIRLTVAEIDARYHIDWFAAGPVTQPIGIAAIDIGTPPQGVPGARDASDTVDTQCRDDLLWVNGRAVSVRVEGSRRAALAGDGLALHGCEPVHLSRGENTIETASRRTGLTVDRLWLHPEAHRDAPMNALGSEVTTAPAAPHIVDIESGRAHNTVRIGGFGNVPYWITLGQSVSYGWHARIENGPDLGPARLVDGFANGWLLSPDTIAAIDGYALGDDVVIVMEWVPNRAVRWGLWISAAALGAATVIVLAAVWYRRRGVERGVVTPRWGQDHAAAPHRQPSCIGLRTVTGAEVSAAISDAAVRAIAVGCGLAVGVSTWWLAGLITTVLIAAPRWWSWGRHAMGLVALLSLAAMSMYTVALQIRYQAPHDGAWPALWYRSHLLGLIAIAAVIARWVWAIIDAHAARRRSAADEGR